MIYLLIVPASPHPHRTRKQQQVQNCLDNQHEPEPASQQSLLRIECRLDGTFAVFTDGVLSYEHGLRQTPIIDFHEERTKWTRKLRLPAR